MDKREKRDVLLRASRKYIRLGLYHRELSPLRAYQRILGVSKKREDALDLMAFYDTARFLRIAGKQEALRVFLKVYYRERGGRFAKNDISYRVLRCAKDEYCDERTVYRHLKTVKTLFEAIRAEYDGYGFLNGNTR